MAKPPWTPKSKTAGPPKADLRAQAAAEVAAFLAAGGSVKRGPDVVPTIFVCHTCGHKATVGVAPGKKIRCPKCGAVSENV